MEAYHALASDTQSGGGTSTPREPEGPRSGKDPIGPEELGRRIRKARLEKQFTLKQVEEASGLSATHLSEIERGRTSPTIGALIRIARSLKRAPSYFIESEERPEIDAVPARSGDPIPAATGVTAFALSRGIPGHRLFPYRLALDPGAVLDLEPQPIPADVLYHVVDGVVAVTIGDLSWTLEAGDFVHGTLDVPNRIVAAARGPAVVLAVLGRSLAAKNGATQ